ncbi:MAG TPA: YciI family protein [Polyangiaceae bacterium]
MHKVDSKMEAGEPPSGEIIERMGELIGESVKSGVCLDGAGLHRSARRVRLRTRGKEKATEHGPYSGDNELVASMAMIKARSMDEASELAQRFAAAAGHVDVEIGPVVEAWDLGVMPKPKSEYERYLLLLKGNARTESGESPSAEERAATAALAEELARTGALLKRVALASSSKGKRLASAPKNERRWIDGPFSESKELIAGFAILELPGIDEAIAWAERYVAILGDVEVDVRLLMSEAT